jgi:ABC-type Fe3+ transport system permease subunit
MSLVLETFIMFAPWALGMTDGALTAYYANNFNSLNVVAGRVVGGTGNALFGTGAATLAVQSWAVLEWLKYVMKMQEGKISVQNRNKQYGRVMALFWWFMLLFYLVSLTLAALDVHLVTHFSQVDVSISTDESLQGSYGYLVKGFSYASLAVGSLTFCTYLYGEIMARKRDEARPSYVEAHGGEL